VAEQRVQAAADREKITLELANQAKRVVEVTKAQEVTLAELEAAAVERERRLAAREAEEVARLEELQEREAAVEKELAAGTRRLREHETALQEWEAKVEEFLAERSASIDRIVRWVGEVNPSLETLGASPIWVAKAPSSLGAALQVLDSTAERLRDLEASMHDLLETEGRAVARGTAEHLHQLPEPQSRLPADSRPGRPHPGDGGRCAGRSTGGGGHGGVPHPTPPRTCRK
jgi:hypothetical protein